MAEFYGSYQAFIDHQQHWGCTCDCIWVGEAKLGETPEPEADLRRTVTELEHQHEQREQGSGPPAPDPLTAMREIMRRADQLRRVLLVHPRDYTLVQAAVDRLPPEMAPGLVEVRATEFTQPGQVIVCQPVEHLLREWKSQL